MESVAQSPDQPPENLGKPKHRRRWWLLIPVLFLVGLTVCGWLTLNSRGAPSYEFLKGMQMIRENERIDSYPPGPDEWIAIAQYRSDLSLQELSELAKGELIPRGFVGDKKRGTPLVFVDSSKSTLIFVHSELGRNIVTIRRTRKANALDRARIWFRLQFSNSPSSPEEDGLYVN